MRLNTRNIILVIVGLVVIGGLIFFGTRESDAPAEVEPTEAVTETGPLFPEVDEEALTRFEVRRLPQTPPEDATETPTPFVPPDATEEVTPEEPQPEPFVVMTKDEEGVWTIDEALNSTDRDTDQMIVVGTIANVVDLQYSDRFTYEETDTTPADFGLDEPQAEIVLAADEEEQRLLLGNRNPGNTRFYTQLGSDDSTVYLVTTDILNNVLNYADQPPYVPAPTATPTPFPTANPFSEVEQTATAQVQFEAMLTAQAEMMGTATPEATAIGPEAAPATEEVTEEATTEATEEVTEEATAEATEEATAEATEEAN